MQDKLVNVYTNVPIENTSVPVLSTILNVRLTIADIRQCINQLAEVYEIIGKGKVIRLNLQNYNKENGGSNNGEVPDGIDDYNVKAIQIVSDFPEDAYTDVLYFKYDSTVKNYIGYMYMPLQYPNDPFHVMIPHVSDEIIDGIVDNNPVTGESVKNYLTKKLHEMSDIDVFGKADKLQEDKHDEILTATTDGNLQASGYKIDTTVDADDPTNPDNKLLVNKQELKNAFKLNIIE